MRLGVRLVPLEDEARVRTLAHPDAPAGIRFVSAVGADDVPLAGIGEPLRVEEEPAAGGNGLIAADLTLEYEVTAVRDEPVPHLSGQRTGRGQEEPLERMLVSLNQKFDVADLNGTAVDRRTAQGRAIVADLMVHPVLGGSGPTDAGDLAAINVFGGPPNRRGGAGAARKGRRNGEDGHQDGVCHGQIQAG